MTYQKKKEYSNIQITGNNSKRVAKKLMIAMKLKANTALTLLGTQQKMERPMELVVPATAGTRMSVVVELRHQLSRLKTKTM